MVYGFIISPGICSLFSVFKHEITLFLQSDEACQQCLEKVSIGMMHMANDAVPMEIDLLNEQLCPVLPWPVEDCKTGVATWWPTIAMRVFDRAVAPYICGPDFIGSCTERPPPKYVHSYLLSSLYYKYGTMFRPTVL